MKGSFFERFKSNAILTGNDEFFEIYRLENEGQIYVIKKTKRSANKHTVIHCENGAIIWEQIYPLGISPVRKRTVITKSSFSECGERGIVLISGKPKCITGLDDSEFVSLHGSIRSDRDIYVMSWKAFAVFGKL